MENGKKVTVSKYLGRVDPETKELLPKIPEKSADTRRKIAEQRSIKMLESIHVADYGAVYLLDHIQRSIKVGEDLNTAFGNVAVQILAVSMTLVQCGGVFDAVEPTMKRTWIKRFYNLLGSQGSSTMTDLSKKIGTDGQANMEKYFRCRIARNKKLVAWDTTTIGCNNEMGGLAEYVKNNKDDEDIPQVKLGIATDIRGVPLMYRHYAGNVSDMDTVKLLANDIGHSEDSEVLFVMDRGFCSGWNIRFMIDNGYRFVVPATVSGKATKRLLTRFVQEGKAVDMRFNDRMYKVWETELGIKADVGRTKADGDQAYTFTTEEDEGHGECGAITAFVCYSYKKYADEMQSQREIIDSLLKKASEIDCKDPVARFRRIAGKAFRHFEVEADGHKVIVKEKKKSKSFQENRAGLFILLATKGTDWSSAMQAYDARRLVEQAFDYKKEDGHRFGTPDKESMKGREFMRFIALTLRCEIAAKIREAGKEDWITGESAIASLDSIQAREYEGTRIISEIDKRQRTILEMLGAEVPTEVLTDRLIFDA
ncbi:MAG: transposase [Candidatus Methanomethylophilaceae archaeon]|nr:transposase [Candidatus Methanomethylophilaceae archaeon]